MVRSRASGSSSTCTTRAVCPDCFEVSGTNITGTYAGVLGEQQITGTIEGNVVRFGFDSPDAGTIQFDGIVDGNTMEGTCEYGQLGGGTFTGTKGS